MSPAEREVIAKAVKELDDMHDGFWNTCAHDGWEWPCPSQRVADDLRRLLETT